MMTNVKNKFWFIKGLLLAVVCAFSVGMTLAQYGAFPNTSESTTEQSETSTETDSETPTEDPITEPEPEPTPDPKPFAFWTTDFEDYELGDWNFDNGDCTNKWNVGIPQWQSGVSSNINSKALFISNNGNVVGYNKKAPSVSIVSKNFFFGDNDSVAIQFDLFVKGESTHDYLKVFLTPLDEEFAPSTDYNSTSKSWTTANFATSSYSTYAAKFGNKYYINDMSADGPVDVRLANPSKTDSVKLVFVWVNDDDYGDDVSAVIDNITIVRDSVEFGAACNDNSSIDSEGFTITSTGLYTIDYLDNNNLTKQKDVYYIVTNQDTTFLDSTICSNQSYKENGFDESTSGVYYQTIKRENKCDSIVILTLTVNDTSITDIFDTICENQVPYVWPVTGHSYTKSGDYVITATNNNELKTWQGCDSTVIYHLTIDSAVHVTIDTTICWDQTFEFSTVAGKTLSEKESGTYTYEVLATDWDETAFECIDTLYTVNLTVLPNSSKRVFDTVCFDSSYFYEYTDYDGTVKHSAQYDELKENKEFTVTYQELKTTHLGNEILCAVIDTVQLFVRAKIDTSFEDTICYGINYHFGKTDTIPASESGDELFLFWDTIQSEVCECDSTIKVQLYVLPKVDTLLIEADHCFGDTVEYGTKIFYCDVEGLFEDADTIPSLVNPDCDSVIKVRINVFPQVGEGFVDTTICYHGEYVHQEPLKSYSFEGTDTQLFLDTLHMENYNGCDSTIYITIHILPNHDTVIYDSVCNKQRYYYSYTELGEEKTVQTAILNSDYKTAYTYDVYDTIENGNVYQCSRTDSVYVHVIPEPVAEIYDTICFGGTYVRDDVDTTFDISKGNISQEIITINPSVINGCDSSTYHYVYILKEADTARVNQVICFGDTVYYDPDSTIMRTYAVGDSTYNDTVYIPSMYGCDSLVYVAQVIVLPEVENGIVDADVCFGSSYTLTYSSYEEGGVLTEYSKTYDPDGSFNTIYDTLHLKTIENCDSTVYVSVKVRPIYDTIIIDTICNNETYVLNGIEYTKEGKYVQNLTTVEYGCDSIVNLYLTVNKTAVTTFDAQLCKGEAYTQNNFNESETGTYIQELQTIDGCDSTVTLNLQVNEFYRDTIYAELCYGTMYNDNGFTVSEGGIYTHEYVTAGGCDSSVTLILTILDNDTTIYATICNEESYLENGFNEKETGIYTRTLTNQYGCDSTITLDLTVVEPIVTNLSAVICQGEIYSGNGFNVSTAGKHMLVYESYQGCDSTVILTLITNPIYDTTINAEICKGEIYDANNFIKSETGVYIKSLHTINGCDSVVSLNLNVKDFSDTIITSICEGQTYTEHGFSVSKAGQYTRTIANENDCDSTITLILSVNPKFDTSITAEICEGQSYTDNGFAVAATGTYTQNLQTINGCDSTITLNLIAHAPAIEIINTTICSGQTYTDYGFNAVKTGTYTKQFTAYNGCDSVLQLNLTVNPVYDTTIYASIWMGEMYNQYGFMISDQGTYVQNKQTINGCDSIITLHLTVIDQIDSTIYASICEGETYDLNGFSESATGTYLQNIHRDNTVDSLVTLELTVNPKYEKTINAAICQGETYTLNGFNENTTGTYVKNLKTINGCDSVVTLNLTVNSKFETPISASICYGQTYTENGFNKSNPGTYSKNLKTINGCDSTVILTLTVLPKYDTIIAATICDGEIYEGNGFNEHIAGIYTQNLQSIDGCDSIVKLNLKVAPIYDTVFQANICEGDTYSLHGFSATEEGIYIQELQSKSGCDSIVHLNLGLLPKHYSHFDATICQGETYTQNGFLASTDGDYTLTLFNTNGCDSIVTLHLETWPSYDITLYDTIESGETADDYSDMKVDTLQTINGCDSIITTYTYYHFTSGLLAVADGENISLFPNPAKDVVTIKSEGKPFGDNIFIVDNMGRIVKIIEVENGATEVNVNVSDIEMGVYYVRIGKQNRKLIVK